MVERQFSQLRKITVVNYFDIVSGIKVFCLPAHPQLLN